MTFCDPTSDIFVSNVLTVRARYFKKDKIKQNKNFLEVALVGFIASLLDTYIQKCTSKVAFYLNFWA